MSRRGRPPHPDILTPREWEVVDLLREGLTNEQIAARLEISPDGAKYHVAQILTKLGVSSRTEAPSVADRNRGQPVRRFLLLPLAWKAGFGKAGNAIASAAIVATAAAALIILFFALRDHSQRPFDMYPGLYVLDLDTGKVQRKIDLRDGQTVHYEWSPDGRRFVVQRRFVPDDLQQLQVYDSATGSLLAKDSLNLSELRFSQLEDGRLGLIFTRNDEIAGERREAPAHVGILNSGDLRLLSDQLVGQVWDILASWAPDGASVVVQTDPSDRATFNYLPLVERTVDLASGIIGPPSPMVAWSPDGSMYAVAVQSFSATEIRDGKSNTVLSTLPAAALAWNAYFWSPDSKWLAMMEQSQMTISPADGSSPPRTLTTGHFGLGLSRNDGTGQPSWSPDSKTIAFVNDDAQIWKVDVASGQLSRLYGGGYPDLTEPRWSPDGKKLAFRVNSSPGIYIAASDGSNTKYVATGTNPELSPTGEFVAFFYPYSPDLHAIRTDGKGYVALTQKARQGEGTTNGPQRTDPCPGLPILPPGVPPPMSFEWSPDGSSFATGTVGAGLMLRSLRQPGQEEPLSSQAFGSSWSPDGSRFAYVTQVSPGECNVVLEDNSQRVITSVPGYGSTWVGGNHLLVRSANGAPAPTSTGSVLLDKEGGEVRRFAGAAAVSPRLDLAFVTTGETGGELVEVGTGRLVRRWQTQIMRASFSPDGRYLALRYRNGLDLLDAATGASIRFIDNGSGAVFSPDSHYLAYDTFVCCENVLYMLHIDSPDASPQEVKRARGMRDDPVWSPESTHLAFTYRTTERAGHDTLVVLDRSTMALTEIAGNASHLQWLPDGKRILYQGDVDP